MATVSALLCIFIATRGAELESACILPVRKICGDSDGNSTLGSFNLTLNVSTAYGGDNYISPSIGAESIKFRLTPADYSTTWHNCPVSQFIMNMNAANLVTFSNGQTTVFEAGEIFYCDDAGAFGHKSQSFKNQSRYSVFVEVDDSFDAGPCPNPPAPTKRDAGDIPLCSDTVSAGMMALSQLAEAK